MDPTLFVWKKRGKIIGIMVTHVDDFCFGGNEEFLRDIIGGMKKKLKIGEEKEEFLYLTLRIKKRRSGDTVIGKIVKCFERM